MQEYETQESAPDTAAISALSYEQALEQLELTIGKLEDGSAPLAETVELFERGCQLRDHCERLLNDAQSRIDKIVAARSAGD